MVVVWFLNPFLMQESWYLDRIEFLSIPTDTLDWLGVKVSDCKFLVSLVLDLLCVRIFGLTIHGLLVGLILSCRLIQGSAITPAFPVRFARRKSLVRIYMKDEKMEGMFYDSDVLFGHSQRMLEKAETFLCSFKWICQKRWCKPIGFTYSLHSPSVWGQLHHLGGVQTWEQ